MAREFRLPDIGEGLTEAEIVRWLVAVGDEVIADQPIVEVETDKAVVEIPSPYAGVVVSLGGAEGEVIAVGAVLVSIGEPGEVPSPEASGEAGEAQGETRGSEAWDNESRWNREPAPIVGTLSDEAESLTPPVESRSPASAAIKTLPIVRKLARDNGIDLEMVDGTGPGGRITRADIDAILAGEGSVAPAGDVVTEPASVVADVPIGSGHGVASHEDPELESNSEPEPAAAVSEGDRRPMSRLRRTIAANMAKSWAEIPHVTTFDDVDATRLLEVRRALGDRHDAKIPVEALLIKAVLPALDAFPEFNASLDGDDLVLHSAKDIGIAVDTAEGLMVAVIRGADTKGVLELAAEVRRLGQGARSRSLPLDELSGQTFTVSNIGAVGGGHGTPIVPYGTVAILSVGQARLRPVVLGGDGIGTAPLMPLSLSYDHRVVDGAVGRRFMALVIENLEEPALFLAV